MAETPGRYEATLPSDHHGRHPTSGAPAREIWDSVTVRLWADEPLDGEGEWDEARAAEMRAAFDALGLQRVVEAAINAALSRHPKLAAFRVVPVLSRDD